jgi:hypothetical protein
MFATAYTRYILSDDYYAAPLPQVYRGRDIYIPQYGLGRLIESPADMVAQIDSYLATPTITADEAFVTGYDFLVDQATAIADTLTAEGVEVDTSFVNNTWTTSQFNQWLAGQTIGPDLISLNSHFSHYSFYPNDHDEVFASQITDDVDFRNSFVFSVGCHSGLNVPDDPNAPAGFTTDWAQAFARQGAMYIANTGFGYGDSEFIAYSERIMVNFVEELTEQPAAGLAFRDAKQRYFNNAAAGTFGVYDEKSMAVMTFYGLPMQQINLPAGLIPPRAPEVQLALAPSEAATITLNFEYDLHTTGRGDFYTLAGQNDILLTGGRPVQPRTVVSLDHEDLVAHGVVLVGGTFTEETDFNPVITEIITEELYLTDENNYPFPDWYPVLTQSINRFLTVDGVFNQQVVVVPGQFIATPDTSPTSGIQRLYQNMELAIYAYPHEVNDFVPPTINGSYAQLNNGQWHYTIQASDESDIQRVVVLYRTAGSNQWQKLELPYNSSTQEATYTLDQPAEAIVDYFIQVVDGAGNVAIRLSFEANHGPLNNNLYLPLVNRQ